MSNHPTRGRARHPKRRPPEKYNAEELHRLCVADYRSGVHTGGNAPGAAIAWFANACARLGRLRGITTDQAFLEVRHAAETEAGRTLL